MRLDYELRASELGMVQLKPARMCSDFAVLFLFPLAACFIPALPPCRTLEDEKDPSLLYLVLYILNSSGLNTLH
jgi:hypothetical protein